MTSRKDKETTLHLFATPNTETQLNPANTSGHSKTITSTTLSHGVFFHVARPTTAQAKDATSVLKKSLL